MILRIGRRSSSRGRCLEAASLLLRPEAAATETSMQAAATTPTTPTIADSRSPLLPRSLPALWSRGFASQPASVAADDSYDNQPGFDEDEEVTVNPWLQGK